MHGQMAGAGDRGPAAGDQQAIAGHRPQGLQLSGIHAGEALPFVLDEGLRDAKREILCSFDRCLHAPPLCVTPRQGDPTKYCTRTDCRTNIGGGEADVKNKRWAAIIPWNYQPIAYPVSIRAVAAPEMVPLSAWNRMPRTRP